jgi:pentatricopeptide repeat protein
MLRATFADISTRSSARFSRHLIPFPLHRPFANGLKSLSSSAVLPNDLNKYEPILHSKAGRDGAPATVQVKDDRSGLVGSGIAVKRTQGGGIAGQESGNSLKDLSEQAIAQSSTQTDVSEHDPYILDLYNNTGPMFDTNRVTIGGYLESTARNLYKRRATSWLQGQLGTKTPPDIIPWLQKIKALEQDADEVLQLWNDVPETLRPRLWEYLHLQLLFKAPLTLCEVLPRIWPSARATEKLVQDIIHAVFYKLLSPTRLLDEKFYKCLFSVVNQMKDPVSLYARLPKEALIRKCPLALLPDLEKQMQQFGPKVHWESYLQATRKFAAAGQADYALQKIFESVNAGADRFSVDFHNSIAALASGIQQRPGDGKELLEYVVLTLIKSGVELHSLTYTMLMDQAAESGSDSIAFEIWSALVAKKQAIYPRMYKSLLLAMRNSEDLNRLELVSKNAAKHALNQNNSSIGTDIVHCQYLFHKRTDSKELYRACLSAYLRIFEPSSLTQLGLPLTVSARWIKDERLMPSPHVMTIMLSAYLEQHRDNQSAVIRTYTTFRASLDQRRPEAMRAVRSSPAIFNVFLLALSRLGSEYLQECMNILALVSAKPSPEDALSENDVVLAKPDAYTWTVLQNAFGQHGQLDAAKRVFEQVKQHGTKENIQVGYDTLISAFSKAQDTQRAADAFFDMVNDGHSVTEHTMRALSRVKDRHLLAKAMDVDEIENVESKG